MKWIKKIKMTKEQAIQEMKKSLEWWESLTEEGKERFPKPTNVTDIQNYYSNPAEYIQLEYGMI